MGFSLTTIYNVGFILWGKTQRYSVGFLQLALVPILFFVMWVGGKSNIRYTKILSRHYHVTLGTILGLIRASVCTGVLCQLVICTSSVRQGRYIIYVSVQVGLSLKCVFYQQNTWVLSNRYGGGN